MKIKFNNEHGCIKAWMHIDSEQQTTNYRLQTTDI